MNTTETIQQFFERIVAASQNRKTPSSRNRRIADEVWVNGRTQTDVAAEYGLSQRRISQICQQVDRWYSETEAWERGELCGGTEQRFESELARRQLTEIYRRAMRGHARSEKPLVTRRSRTSEGATMWSEETEREQRQDTGSLRVAMRAIEQRTKLDRRGEPMPVCGRVQYFEWALGALANLRAEAERRGEVPRSLEGPHALVERIVREILGGAGGERQVSREGETPAQPQALLGKPTVAPHEASAACGLRNAECEDKDLKGEAREGEAREGEAPAEPRGVTAMDEAGLNGHVTRRVTPAVAPHPVGSSSTSRPRGVEAEVEAEYADEVVAVSDAAAASYDESTGGDWTLAPAEKTGRRSPVRRQPTESAEEAQARVLAALSRAYDCGMNRASADQQLTEYLLDRYRPHPLWSYSAQQHAALDEWNRVRNRSDRGAAARVA